MSGGDKKNILLVEDEALIAMAEKAQLERYGYAVVTATSGEKAVEAVERNPGIDLILMDVDLGSGMDGTQAAAIILESRDIPVVFVSSHGEREIVERTEKITSYGYVVKSSSITVLDASIKMAFKLFDEKEKVDEAIDALRTHAQLLENVIDRFPGFVIWKDTDSVIRGCNNNFALKCGYSSSSEIIGKTDYDLPFRPDEADSFLADDREVMRTGIPKLHFEEVEHVADNELMTLETSKMPLYDASGRVSGILAVATDVSERRKL
jgi:PAS domain S-box-containing protein